MKSSIKIYGPGTKWRRDMRSTILPTLRASSKRRAATSSIRVSPTSREYRPCGKDNRPVHCNNGRELISAVQLGARAGLGFDFSTAFIRQARDLCDGAGVNIDFIETDIYEIPARYSAVSDVLMMTSGALCWMPDLRRYFGVASRVLGPGGSLVIYETHPFLEMF